MDRIMEEDLELMEDRMNRGSGAPIDDSCAPVIPETYDVLDDFFKKEASEIADAYFRYHVVEKRDEKGRRLEKNLEKRR